MPTRQKSSSARRPWRKVLSPGICVCLIVGIICLIGGIVAVANPRTKQSAELYTVTDLAPVEPIKPGVTLEQKFTAQGDYTSFGLYFANFSSPIHQGTLVLTIQPEGSTSTTFERSLASLLDNNFVYFDYDLTAGTKYTVRIHTQDTTSPITFFTSTSDRNPATLSINGKSDNRHLIMTFTRPQKDIFLAWYFFMGAAFAIFITLLTVNKEFYVGQKSA